MSPFSLFAMKRRRTEKHIPLYLQGQTTSKALSQFHEFRIRKNEKGNVSFSVIAMKLHWTKHIYHSACICKTNRRQTRYIPLIYLHAFRLRKKEKRNISFFLIRYETALDRKTYTNILVRLKDDKRAIHH